MQPEVYISFVVRLWCEAGDRWHGEVEHIQTGNRWSFVSLARLLDFLRLAADTPNTFVEASRWDGEPEDKEQLHTLSGE